MGQMAVATTATTVVALLVGGVGAVGAAPSGPGGDHRPRHSSDDQPGLFAPRGVVPAPFGGAEPVVVRDETSRVARGLLLRQWRQEDPRGKVRVHLLTGNLAVRGLRLRHAAPGKVADSMTVGKLVRRASGVAGVNGDFFDISDTAAPLGVGVDDGRLRHGPGQNWTLSFVLDRDGSARVEEAPLQGSVTGHPDLTVTNLNSPHVAPHGVGVYTPAWGRTPGRRVVEGAKRMDLREVTIRGGKVVSNRRTLSKDRPIRGRVLIGRGAGASALRALRVGSRARVVTRVEGRPDLVISGSEKLLGDGEVLATDDVALHPRTAVGIDRDRDRILLMVVDGRSEKSRGVTLVELAMLLQEAGAEEALNLDGGGSTTMVARDEDRRVGVVNAPSDGRQRKVPNGLAFVSRR